MEPLYRRFQALDAADIHLDHAYLAGADLAGARLLRASLEKTILTEANLTEAFLIRANLTGTNLEAAASLKGTQMNGVIGLSLKQQKACAEMGAIFDGSEVPPPGPSDF